MLELSLAEGHVYGICANRTVGATGALGSERRFNGTGADPASDRGPHEVIADASGSQGLRRPRATSSKLDPVTAG